MKIALCISGHMRCYKELQSNFLEFKKHISNFGEVDTFICTCDKHNSKNSWSSANNLSDISNYNKYVDQEDIKSIYNYKDIKILQQDFYNSEYSPLIYKLFTNNSYNYPMATCVFENNIISWLNMLFLIHECNLLKKKYEFLNRFKYDTVIKLRPDFYFLKDEMMHNINTLNINNKKLNLSRLYNSQEISNTIYKDIFAFGPSDIMDIYCNCIYNISEYFNNNIFGDSEKIITSYLKKYDIKINTIEDVGKILTESKDIKNRLRS